MGCDRAWEAAGSGHTLWSLLQLLGGILQHRFRRPGFNNVTHSLTTRGRNPNDNHCDARAPSRAVLVGPSELQGHSCPWWHVPRRCPPALGTPPIPAEDREDGP